MKSTCPPAASQHTSGYLTFTTALAATIVIGFALPLWIDGAQPSGRLLFVALAVYVVPALCAVLSRLLIARTPPRTVLPISMALRVTATIALSCFGVGYEGLFEEYFPPFPNISDFVMVMWPAGVTLMVAGPAAFVLTHKMDQERLDFVARISCAVMLAMLVLVTFRVFVSPVSLAVSSHIQRYDVALTPRLPLIVFLAGLMIAGASRIRLPAGTRGHAVTALVFATALLLTYPTSIKPEYFHAHPVVAPAHFLVNGGLLLKNVFSQYGSGPVVFSALAQSIGGSPFESTAIAIQFGTYALLLIGCALVVIPLCNRKTLAVSLIALVLLASPFLLFGAALYSFPSLFLWRFLIPCVIAISLFCMHGNMRIASSVGGVLLGVSPYWALETVPIGFAMLVSYLLFLTVREYSARNIATQAAIVALGAATSFAALTAAYFAVVGQLPRFNIQYEMMSTYLAAETWHSTDLPRSLFYFFPLVITAGYGLLFTFCLLDRRGSIMLPRLEQNSGHVPLTQLIHERAWLSLHLLATLTAVGTLYFIGRSYSWVMPGALFFGVMFCILAACLVLELGPRASKSLRPAALTALTCTAIVSCLAIDLLLEPKGVGGRYKIVANALANGSIPSFKLKPQFSKLLRRKIRAPFDQLVTKYLAEGRQIEVVTSNDYSAEIIRMARDLPYHLPVSAYLSDSLSPTRSRELIAATEMLPNGLIIITSAPGAEKKVIRRHRSLALDLVEHLRGGAKLCKLEQIGFAVAYEYMRSKKCPDND